MKFASLALTLPALAAAAKYSKEDYVSGRVHMESMSRKEASWARQRANGQMDSSKYPSWSKGPKGPPKGKRDHVKCINGKAEVVKGDPLQTFQCKDMDFYDFMSHADLGSWAGEGSDTWGWVGPGGREFIAIGQADGTAFAEITKKGKLVYLGRLPQQSVTSIWHDIKGYKNYIVVGSEAVGHGVQIFDMTKLLDPSLASSPRNFSTTEDLTGWFDGLPNGRSHNLVSGPEENGYIVAVGAQPRTDECASGLIYIDISDPANPYSPGCAGQDGYSHDAQCVIYHGPDSRYEGRDICYSFNEDTVTIYDSTDREGLNTSKVLSATPYTGAAYTHQGWLLDQNWQQYLLSDDELDEVDGVEPAADGRSVMYIWDISDLENPVNTGYHKASSISIDHNLYVHDGLAYQSNYGSGLRVLDVSGIPEDPTGGNIYEYAYFDIYPEDDADPQVEFVGTWSNYLFPSGYVFVNSIERGGFVLKMAPNAGKGPKGPKPGKGPGGKGPGGKA